MQAGKDWPTITTHAERPRACAPASHGLKAERPPLQDCKSAAARDALGGAAEDAQRSLCDFIAGCVAVLHPLQLARMLCVTQPWPPDALQITRRLDGGSVLLTKSVAAK